MRCFPFGGFRWLRSRCLALPSGPANVQPFPLFFLHNYTSGGQMLFGKCGGWLTSDPTRDSKNSAMLIIHFDGYFQQECNSPATVLSLFWLGSLFFSWTFSATISWLSLLASIILFWPFWTTILLFSEFFSWPFLATILLPAARFLACTILSSWSDFEA